ncbi:MAG: uroporphyrinogen decarboxylase family protein [Lentisphaeria bacterium]|nr:uroporphyrinogen decarboxylase family protein [Lentisphaeria bacterium]
MAHNPFEIQSLPAPSPDFKHLLKVLRGETPDRPTLFEFFLNGPLYRRLAETTGLTVAGAPEWLVTQRGFYAAGYDYATTHVPNFEFAVGAQEKASSLSLNKGVIITDRASFDTYAWPDPALADYDHLDTAAATLPAGMKLIVPGPFGVLENVIRLVGYENLCLMILDDEQLVYDIFERVGGRLARFYQLAAPRPGVGACISNDDWGFNTQTMLSPDDMRRFVFPWHKRIVESIHAAGKPAILHSCGYYGEIMDDIVEEMKYDGRHSYEDTIIPVEKAYDDLRGRIAVLGGIDVDYICRHSPREVFDRARKMVEKGQAGGYALGTGNSVPEYVPDEAYLAMILAAVADR